MVNTQTQSCFSQQMLYRQDSHSAPTLYLASKSRIDIPVPEDFTHAFVQIRVTGPGGDGVPAEVHILRNSGTYTSLLTGHVPDHQKTSPVRLQDCLLETMISCQGSLTSDDFVTAPPRHGQRSTAAP